MALIWIFQIFAVVTTIGGFNSDIYIITGCQRQYLHKKQAIKRSRLHKLNQMKKVNSLAIFVLIILTISLLFSCDNNGGCPEGSDPLYDNQNNVLGCIDQNPGDR